jgi:hypothetical protein
MFCVFFLFLITHSVQTFLRRSEIDLCLSAAWDGELDLELSLGCAGGERGGDRTTVADEAFNSAPGKQRTGLTVR